MKRYIRSTSYETRGFMSYKARKRAKDVGLARNTSDMKEIRRLARCEDKVILGQLLCNLNVSDSMRRSIIDQAFEGDVLNCDDAVRMGVAIASDDLDLLEQLLQDLEPRIRREAKRTIDCLEKPGDAE